jgi:hypothetical protein
VLTLRRDAVEVAVHMATRVSVERVSVKIDPLDARQADAILRGLLKASIGVKEKESPR